MFHWSSLLFIYIFCLVFIIIVFYIYFSCLVEVFLIFIICVTFCVYFVFPSLYLKLCFLTLSFFIIYSHGIIYLFFSLYYLIMICTVLVLRHFLYSYLNFLIFGILILSAGSIKSQTYVPFRLCYLSPSI